MEIPIHHIDAFVDRRRVHGEPGRGMPAGLLAARRRDAEDRGGEQPGRDRLPGGCQGRLQHSLDDARGGDRSLRPRHPGRGARRLLGAGEGTHRSAVPLRQRRPGRALPKETSSSWISRRAHRPPARRARTSRRRWDSAPPSCGLPATILAVFESEAEVRALAPDMTLMKRLDRAVIATAPGAGDVDFVSRFFAPTFGIDEDPVTGSSHCTLVPYWSRRLGKKRLHAQPGLPPRRGSPVRRPGRPRGHRRSRRHVPRGRDQDLSRGPTGPPGPCPGAIRSRGSGGRGTRRCRAS